MKLKSILLTAVATISLATATMAQVPNYVPTNGLVGWWPFDGNANDESGNGNNGTVNGATLTTDRFGNSNKAYGFDGANAYINVQNSASLQIVNAITLSAWARPDTVFSAPQTFGGRLIDKCTVGATDGYVLDLGANVNGISGGLEKRARFIGVTNQVFSTEFYTASHIWYHICLTFDGTSAKFYVNGVLDTINSLSGALQINNLPLTFGGHNQQNNSWFFGKIDDIGIWNRALTQQEITDLYNGCQLTVNTQPNSQTININNNTQFTVSSSDPSATYQWQTDLGIGFQNLNSVGQYSGTTNDTLTVSNVTMSNNNQPFRCIVSFGSCSDTSNVAALTVNNNVGINETIKENLFSVFPNPAKSLINVKADSKLVGEVYSICDHTGKVVLAGKFNSENTTIELGNLPSGIYMFSVGENMKKTFKVIKE